MTPEEAIEILSNELIVITDMIGYCKDFEKESDLALAYRVKRQEAHKIAISVLKEIHQYHKIGTVEECREAVWKQKPKKRIYPKTALERYYHAPECPNCKRELKPRRCGYTLSQAIGIYSYCPWCGQNLEGVEESEGEEKR